MNLPEILKYNCINCKDEKDFKYSSSTLLAGKERIDFYACECGEIYTLTQMMTLRNMERLRKCVTTKKR